MYKMIQKNIDVATSAAISADSEELRALFIGDVRYWECKKIEWMNTHTIGEANAKNR